MGWRIKPMTPPSVVPLDYLTQENIPPKSADRPFGEPIPPKGLFWRTRAAVKLLTFAAFTGVIFAALLSPFALIPGLTSRTLIEKWEALPATLPFDQALPQRVVMTDRNGEPFATLYSENRIPLTLDRISPYVIDALLATEDARFYEHNGVDLKGLGRAALNNSSGGSRQGASTLTQQYVKNILLYAARTEDEKDAATETSLMRKIKEARYAIELENTLTKDQILEGYLNTVYFGDGAYGIGAAAQHYFKKNASDLTIGEAATLVGILKSTSNYDPTNDIDAATDRRDVVINRMVETGKITEMQGDAAKQQPIVLNVRERRNGCVVSRYPMYCQWVKEEILTNPAYGETPQDREKLLEMGGFTITTALDPEVQDYATKAAVRALGAKNRVAAGIAVVQPGTGEVLALATNKPWGQDKKRGQTELLLPTLPAYQPGSNFKPFVLATALEQGIPATTRFDTPNNYIPAKMNHPDDGFSNDDDQGHGVIDAYRATADSVNTYFIQLIEKTGVKPVADLASRIGITSLPEGGPLKITNKDASLALGAYEVSPLEMAEAYATFAAHGVTCKPVGVLDITTLDGKSIPVAGGDCHQAISPAVADTVTDVLQAPMEYGTGSSLKLDDGRPSAGKTGTTNDSAATWFTGYTPQYAVSVWIGDPRGGQRYPLKNVRAFGTTYPVVYGSYIAGPIWNDIMNYLHKDEPIMRFPKPGTVTESKPTVPNVTGLTIPAAIEVLQQNGYTVVINPETAKPVAYAGPGQVAAQKPDAGGQYGPGTEVTLTLTSGSDTNIKVEP